MGEFIPVSITHYSLTKRLSELGRHRDGTTKEVTLGKWNGELRLDIRRWKGDALGKDITLNEDEVRLLRKTLDELDFGR